MGERNGARAGSSSRVERDIRVPVSGHARRRPAQRAAEPLGRDPRIDDPALDVSMRRPRPGERVVDQTSSDRIEGDVAGVARELVGPAERGRCPRGDPANLTDRAAASRAVAEHPREIDPRLGRICRVNDDVEVVRHEHGGERPRERLAEAWPEPGGDLMRRDGHRRVIGAGGQMEVLAHGRRPSQAASRRDPAGSSPRSSARGWRTPERRWRTPERRPAGAALRVANAEAQSSIGGVSSSRGPDRRSSRVAPQGPQPIRSSSIARSSNQPSFGTLGDW